MPLIGEHEQANLHSLQWRDFFLFIYMFICRRPPCAHAHAQPNITVAKADHQKLLDDVRGGSSSSTLVQIRETVTWSRIWDQALTYSPKAVDDTKKNVSIIVHPTIC